VANSTRVVFGEELLKITKTPQKRSLISQQWSTWFASTLTQLLLQSTGHIFNHLPSLQRFSLAFQPSPCIVRFARTFLFRMLFNIVIASPKIALNFIWKGSLLVYWLVFSLLASCAELYWPCLVTVVLYRRRSFAAILFSGSPPPIVGMRYSVRHVLLWNVFG
jgi:hypothetical protein